MTIREFKKKKFSFWDDHAEPGSYLLGLAEMLKEPSTPSPNRKSLEDMIVNSHLSTASNRSRKRKDEFWSMFLALLGL